MNGRAVTSVVGAIAAHRFRYADEDQLQDGLADALVAAGFDVRREVRLNARDRIDLLVGRVGVEVKVAGAPSSVWRQLRRYAESPEVDALVLVTSRMRHTSFPDEVGGKPVAVVSLAGAGL